MNQEEQPVPAAEPTPEKRPAVVPLYIGDTRFETLRKMSMNNISKKFALLFKKTKDAKERSPADEFAAFLANFSFLGVLHMSMQQKDGGNALKTYLDTFNVLANHFVQNVQTAQAEPVAESVVEHPNEEVSNVSPPSDATQG